jgi:hypothetical protein
MFVATAAYAQNPPPAAPTGPAPTSGPLVLERIHDAWVIAPDFKVTDVDGRRGELAGAYGGKLLDNTLFIGGAAYWLANDARDFKMTYGGAMVGWQSREYGRIRFGGRGLAGVGSATLGFDVSTLTGGALPLGGRTGDIRFGVIDPRAQLPVRPGVPLPTEPLRQRVIARDDFVFVEPQANVGLRLTKGIGVSCGVGYRQTGSTDILRDRLNGPTANLAVQFGW